MIRKLPPFCLYFTICLPLCLMLFACQRDYNPIAPDPAVAARGNYAQMLGGSKVVAVNGVPHQLNLLLSQWPAFPYGNWIYAEINEQRGQDYAPGEHQVPVHLRDVTFTFTGLPAEISAIVVAIKARDAETDRYDDLETLPVRGGTLAIPVAHADLTRYFGETHYSVWFRTLGGRNGQGISADVTLTLRGVMPDGARVAIPIRLRFGTNPPPTPTPAPTLPVPTGAVFFSEYIEGSIHNKALEVYNGTAYAIDLTAEQYVIEFYFNGETSPDRTIFLQGTVAPQDVFVLTNDHAIAQIIADADQIDPSPAALPVWFNGNDPVVLKRGGASGTIIDVIGQIGTDPGSQWGAGLTSTQDNTLRRKAGIIAGDPNPDDTFDQAQEWDGFAQDTFDGLGAR